MCMNPHYFSAKSNNEDSNDNDKKLRNNRWMNPKCHPYKPTVYEHYANILTHGFVILPSVIGAISLTQFSKTHDQYKSTMIYGISLILLFTVSTLFHWFSLISQIKNSYWREFFHYCDRAIIYIFIASSYTPWLHLRSTNGMFGDSMVVIVWVGAFMGIAYQIIFHEKYKLLEIVFYLVIGICPSIVVIDMVDSSGLTELAVGGAFFVTGVLFFKSDGIIPFAHAIWHIFVCIGACVHYYAIFTYLL